MLTFSHKQHYRLPRLFKQILSVKRLNLKVSKTALPVPFISPPPLAPAPCPRGGWQRRGHEAASSGEGNAPCLASLASVPARPACVATVAPTNSSPTPRPPQLAPRPPIIITPTPSTASPSQPVPRPPEFTPPGPLTRPPLTSTHGPPTLLPHAQGPTPDPPTRRPPEGRCPPTPLQPTTPTRHSPNPPAIPRTTATTPLQPFCPQGRSYCP